MRNEYVMQLSCRLKLNCKGNYFLSAPFRSYSEGQGQDATLTETPENPNLLTIINGKGPNREREDLVSEGLSFFGRDRAMRRVESMTSATERIKMRKQSDSRIAFYRAEYMPCTF